MMHATAHAKLTLYLHLLGKRPDDGYHLLDALVVFTDFGDRVSVSAGDALCLQLQGEFAQGLTGDEGDNLLMRAARLMQQHFEVSDGAYITLEKQIPIAAGLGGGSADAAAVMKLLNALWGIDAPLEALLPLAARLGSDIPACLSAAPLRMQGVGERITLLTKQEAAPLQNGALLLVNPRQQVLTAEVYGQCRAPSPAIDAPKTLPSWRGARNDLQPAAEQICPAILGVLSALEAQTGCEVARLCGSGATCFGWFENASAAQRAKQALAQAQPNWWLQEAMILP